MEELSIALPQPLWELISHQASHSHESPGVRAPAPGRASLHMRCAGCVMGFRGAAGGTATATGISTWITVAPRDHN